MLFKRATRVAAPLFLAGLHAFAAEKDTVVLSPQDWTGKDRAAWMDTSNSKTGVALDAWVAANLKNSFLTSATLNTQKNSLGEYTSVAQRQAFYDWTSYVLQFGQGTPAALRDVRFFHATSVITTRLFLGAAENKLLTSDFANKIGVGISTAAKTLIRDINKDLFALNVGVINKLLYVWKEPRSPVAAAPTVKMDPLTFDLTMVTLEQTTVEKLLKTPDLTKDATDGINKALSDGLFLNFPMKTLVDWAAQAGHKNLDFKDIRWRTAIGRAFVFQFHKQGVDAYLNYMKANP